eukprot:TRINITY_DN57781_c0_g1_i1.p1 TRINITY_DN57781_c0_g1~~TRINITY_DN57781_c0_g1_i1.p1  ORF type:complete len:655 (-),score=140.97 TRINITY_DN57781_c0_g1_i1:31-1995(-)
MVAVRYLPVAGQPAAATARRPRSLRAPSALAATCSCALLLGCVHGFDWSSIWGARSPAREKHAVEDLTERNFNEFIAQNPVSLMLFYAPWCFFSQQMIPTWDTVAQKLAIHDPPVALGKIDASRYREVRESYGVNTFPAIKLFIDGTVFDYDVPGRSWQLIVKWVNNHLDRDHILKNVQDVDAFMHDNDLSVIGLFTDGKNGSGWLKSARHFSEVTFAEARGTELSKEVADRLSRHVVYSCTTVFVGASHDGQTKTVLLPQPQENLECDQTPANHQRPEWTDSFKMNVSGTHVTVQRTDSPTGWDQLLQVKCCEKQDHSDKKKLHDVPLPSVVMLMPHDERFAVYDGDMDDFHALDRWINVRRFPTVMRVDRETASHIMEDQQLDAGGNKKPLLVFFDKEVDTWLSGSKSLVVNEAARLLRGRCHFLVSGAGSAVEKRFMELASVDDEILPVVVLLQLPSTGPGAPSAHSLAKYRLAEGKATFEAKDVVTFIESFEAGTLKPWVKSEPVPLENNEPVLTLVGTTYHDIVHDPKKDVLVDYYAPWCGHCRKFEPNYKKLASNLQHVKTLKITKIDATRNDIPDMMLTGFPTIILFAAGAEKRQSIYKGNRAVQHLTEFLMQNCAERFNPTPPITAAKIQEEESGLLSDAEEGLDL